MFEMTSSVLAKAKQFILRAWGTSADSHRWWRKWLHIGAWVLGTGFFVGGALFGLACCVSLAGIAPIVGVGALEGLLMTTGLFGQAFIWFWIPDMMDNVEALFLMFREMYRGSNAADIVCDIGEELNARAPKKEATNG
jgi:hypothetical protein